MGAVPLEGQLMDWPGLTLTGLASIPGQCPHSCDSLGAGSAELALLGSTDFPGYLLLGGEDFVDVNKCHL